MKKKVVCLPCSKDKGRAVHHGIQYPCNSFDPFWLATIIAIIVFAVTIGYLYRG